MRPASRIAFQIGTTAAISRTHSFGQVESPYTRFRTATRSVARRRRMHGVIASYDSRDGGERATSQRGMRPKQSLGQNFLRDVNMVTRIVTAFDTGVEQLCPGAHVVEVGPGLGALTTQLVGRYPDMLTVEIDRRAVQYLNENFPGLAVRHADVLDTDWPGIAREMGKPLAVIGNLPYNIVSQILFSLLEAPSGTIGIAVVMMQKEVAERIIAKTRTKAYGILSVVGQLYSKPKILFPVPNTVFYPKPDVTSAMVQFEFKPDPCLDVRNTTLVSSLRKVVRSAFNQRRKVLRNSLRTLCDGNGVELPDKWSNKRAEELPPSDFVDMTKFIFHKDLENPETVAPNDRPTTVWR